MRVSLSIHRIDSSSTGVVYFTTGNALLDALNHIKFVEGLFPEQNEFGLTADHEAMLEYTKGLDSAGDE